MKKNILIVILFAFLHGATAIFGEKLGLHGGPSLTACTLIMSVLLSYRGKVSTFFATCLAVINCFAGFIIGKTLLAFLSTLTLSHFLASTLPTFISTILLGLLSCFLIETIGKDFRQEKWATRSVVKMTLALLLFLGVRVVMTHRAYASDGITEMDVFTEILGRSEILSVLITANVVLALSMESIKKKFGKRTSEYFLSVMIALLSVAAVLLPFKTGLTNDVVILLCEGLVAELSLYCIVRVIHYSIISRKLLIEEKDKRHIAEFKYSSLKQQVNPHFLFNSLNILYGLMYEDNKEGAMSYTQKLASLYRYMLESEEMPLISLEIEMEFAGKFVDMLAVRHQDAFRIHFDIKDEDIHKQVPPCSVQTCLENVFKHNIVTKNNPIEINIFSDGKRVYIKNTIAPKQVDASSTHHVGHNYIKKIYSALCSEEVLIEKTDKLFTISLPLL